MRWGRAVPSPFGGMGDAFGGDRWEQEVRPRSAADIYRLAPSCDRHLYQRRQHENRR